MVLLIPDKTNKETKMNQEQAIREAEEFLKAQTAQALRSNKTYRGMDKAVSAARVMAGDFAEWASAEEKELAAEFFAAFEQGGFDKVFSSAVSWN
jgi:hypothetical protein